MNFDEEVTDPGEVRNDCAFCHYERVPADDNHAPACPYWVFFSPEANG